LAVVVDLLADIFTFSTASLCYISCFSFFIPP